MRRATDAESELETITETINTVMPDFPTSIEEVRWMDANYPGGGRFIAEIDSRPIGVAIVDRIIVMPPEYDGLWARIAVLDGHRRIGAGTALLRVVSDHARDAGKTALHIAANQERPEGIAFLAHRGFEEFERVKVVELPLDGLSPMDVDPPVGIRLTSLAEAPELLSGVHAVAIESFPDVPGGDAPPVPGDLAEFKARDVDYHAVPKDGFIVAQEMPSGQVVGYASLSIMPGPLQRVAWHDMTAVVRRWRGRGLATTLKKATINWAIGAGLEALQTGNDEANAPMRAVNARLGYRPKPDLVIMRGPLLAA